MFWCWKNSWDYQTRQIIVKNALRTAPLLNQSVCFAITCRCIAVCYSYWIIFKFLPKLKLSSRLQGVVLALFNVPITTRKHLLNLGLCLALIWGVYDALMGPDLVSDLRDFTGRYGAYLLLISLLFTPLSQRWHWVKRHLAMRRNIGVWGFIYAALHVLIWIMLEFYYDWQLMLDEIAGNLFILLGVLAFLLLLPLALTSTHKAIKYLGYRKWQLLHTLTYVAIPAVIAHHFMAQKTATLEPLLMGLVLFLVLVWRYRHVR